MLFLIRCKISTSNSQNSGVTMKKYKKVHFFEKEEKTVAFLRPL